MRCSVSNNRSTSTTTGVVGIKKNVRRRRKNMYIMMVVHIIRNDLSLKNRLLCSLLRHNARLPSFTLYLVTITIIS